MNDELQEAVVLATPEDLSSRVAGVPLLVRTILVLQRAGFERVHVPGAIDVPSDPRIRITIGRETRPEGTHLVVGAGSVVDQVLVAAASRAREGVCWERGARIEGRPAEAAPRMTVPPRHAPARDDAATDRRAGVGRPENRMTGT